MRKLYPGKALFLIFLCSIHVLVSTVYGQTTKWNNLREQKLTERATRLSGPGGFSYFGRTVSVAGDVNGDGYSDVIVGSPYYSNATGAVFVYHGGPNGLSGSPAKTLNGPAQGSEFGSSLSSAGDVNGDGYSDIIIGTYVSPAAGAPVIGSAYVYLGSSSGIADTPANVLLGTSAEFVGSAIVAGIGDVNHDGYSDVMIGRPGVPRDSRVIIFYGSSNGLPDTPSASIEMPWENFAFGTAIAAAGDVNGDGFDDAIVSGMHSPTLTGSVFLFLGGSSGLSLTPAVTWTGIVNSFFGQSLSGAGDVNGDGFADVLIGDYQYDSGRGAAFLYLGSASAISSTPFKRFTGLETYSVLGVGVSNAGDVNADGYADIMIGAPGFTLNNGTGHTYVYYGSENGPGEVFQDLAGPVQNSAFGFAVSAAGDVNGDGKTDVVIGSFLEDGESGAAYVYLGNTTTLSAEPARTFSEPIVNSNFAFRPSGVGDLNGDGFSDVAIGASEHGNNDGIVYIYYGSASGLPQSPSLTLPAPATYSLFGSSVASAGDVNGDGYGDLIVSAPGFNNFFGAAFIYHGGPAGLSTTAARILTDQTWMTYNYGAAVAGADVNGDGYSDVLVGDPGAEQVFVHFGSAAGVSQAVAITLWRTGSDAFGGSLANAGDVNGDGYNDVVIGDYGYDFNRGAAHVFYGSADGLSLTSATLLRGTVANGLFGIGVSGAGDVNADGYMDIAVGAANANSMAVFLGSPGGISQNAVQPVNGPPSNHSFGTSLASAGDVNGDGYSDILVGAWENPPGVAYVYLGGVQGIKSNPDATLSGSQSMLFFGFAVAGVGDVNGDGYSDIMSAGVETSTNQLIVQLFNGNNKGKRNHTLAFYNADLSSPLNRKNAAAHRFGIGLYVSPFGGSRQARLVWETKPNGQAFSSSSPISNYTGFSGSGDWTDIPASGMVMKTLVDKLGGKTTKIRVRIQYKSVDLPSGQVFGPWIYPQDYSNGTLGEQGSPLPVSLTNFQVIREGQSAHLIWETAWEVNSKAFEIQHSMEGRQWNTIGSVAAMQNASEKSRFNFVHVTPSLGQNYYRLKMIDNDDSFAFSTIRNIDFGTAPEVSVFPNPSPGIVKIKAVKKLLSLKVYNLLGNPIQCSYRLNDGECEISGLPSGTYVFSAVLEGADSVNGRFVIQ